MPTHYHEGLCVKNALVIGGDNTDKAKCEAQGGKIQGQTGWMGHYWLPSCDSPDGVFSADNPRLDIGVANVQRRPGQRRPIRPSCRPTRAPAPTLPATPPFGTDVSAPARRDRRRHGAVGESAGPSQLIRSRRVSGLERAELRLSGSARVLVLPAGRA